MEASENACVEYLRPRTLPEQLVALGTVTQVSEIQLKLQITGGIVCLVERSDVSQPYSNLLQGNPDSAAKLNHMFKKGQQYVCKIIEKRARKGYAEAQDIIATTNPTQIQDETLPSTLFAIPNVPLQGAIQSIEDHGYRVEVGFKGLTGFLQFDEAEEYCCKHNDGKKFLVGQIIRCCTKEAVSIGTDSRVIQLSMSKEFIKRSEFSREKCTQNLLTETCILPGSRGFLTVMKVQKDGLIVNFMDEFAGFVSVNHLKDVWHDPKKDYKISNQFKCTVLYYNSTTKNFALSLKTKKVFQKSLKNIMETYHVGQIIKKAEVAYINGLKAVNFKVDNCKALANVKDALQEDVTTMTRDEIHTALDARFPDGSKHKCRIKSINYADLILVLSLREDFLEQPCVSIDELEPAHFIEATVKKYVKDGIVVMFGMNLRAIILNEHLHDYISTKSYKRYPMGKTIKCRVLKVDSTKYPLRVYLTNKEPLMDPEMTIVDSYDKSYRGETVNAIITKLKHDGIIVELFNNVKGFIPRRFCSTVQIRSISDLYQVGQVTACTVYRVDPERHSLLLGIISYEKIVAMKKEKKKQAKAKKEAKSLTRIENMPKAAENKKRKICDDSGEDCGLNSEEKEATEEAAAATGQTGQVKTKKSRLERSKEARLREEKIREAENELLDPKRPAQSIVDFERLVLGTPDSADVWIKYSKFFLDNVETEKARIVCRRALRTINFRLEKEKLKIWLHLIMVEAKYGGSERLHEVIEEAAQTNDRLELFKKAAKVLVTCGELNEAERLHKASIKLNAKSSEVWIDYLLFIMEHRKNPDKARALFDEACRSLALADTAPADLVYLKSRFAHFEFRHGDVERGKTMFENLLSENPKRMDLWKVYEGAVRKFGSRQLDSDLVREQNEQILKRIATLGK